MIIDSSGGGGGGERHFYLYNVEFLRELGGYRTLSNGNLLSERLPILEPLPRVDAQSPL